jgi:Protein of unknown function (DUF3237)
MMSRREFNSAGLGAFATFAAGDAVAGSQQPAASSAPAPLKSEFLMDIILDVAAPQNLGTRRIVPVTGGTFEGPKLKGTALGGGADWILVRPDGVSELNVRVTLRTDDDQLIYLTYRGLLFTPKGGEQYWRTTPIFETGAAKYDWLTKIIAVGVGKTVPGKAAYSIYQIL